MEALHSPIILRRKLWLLPSAGDEVSRFPIGIMSTTPHVWGLGGQKGTFSKILGQQVVSTEARLEGKVYEQ